MQQSSTRAGRYVAQKAGFASFVPARLPPDPPVAFDDELLDLLSRADRALGRLDGSTEALPNPDLFVMMYVRKEAVLSSQIEGTQASLVDVLEVEAQILDPETPADVTEVINYVRALNAGIHQLETLPLSLRLIRNVHGVLLEGARGQERSPGEFRTSQNWIGAEGSTLANARFVPPTPEDMKAALADWESFLQDESRMPFLIRVGLAHAQFETVHPFLDGNGRIGRLLITFLLYEKTILKRPLLYLSYYFKANRLEYYDRLQAVRDKGDWEGWLRFFLKGVAIVADDATEVARNIVGLRERDRAKIVDSCGRITADALTAYEHLFEQPFVTVHTIQRLLEKQYPAANKIVGKLAELGILTEVTGKARRRVFVHEGYFRLFAGDEVDGESSEQVDVQSTSHD